jgi:glutaredoxin
MKKFLVLAVLAFAVYKLYENGFNFLSPAGAFDEQGKPKVVLIVGPGCGAHCDKIRMTLRGRRIEFEEINVAGADGAPVANKYGIGAFPTTLVGRQQLLGDDVTRLTAVLAEEFGKDILTRGERRVMDTHFDGEGHAQVVMYATQWCPYCKKQRDYFASKGIPYKEIDVEASEANAFLYNSLQGSGYPLIYVGYRRFPGYREGDLVAAVKELEKAGPRR